MTSPLAHWRRRVHPNENRPPLAPKGFHRRYISLLIVLITLLAIATGCAHPLYFWAWESTPRFAPLARVELVTVRPESLFGVCYDAARPDARGMACAVRDYPQGVCRVFVVADSPQWLLEHELRHCAGFEHE